ncbi:MAG: MOSC domain-containing protein [Leptotrichiaceae bacterium]|nr:MOSC domain-containing protein [Leptotrichiaceae bacterium]MBP6280578.1 MOSC domain-containing protein [Leptotrichiaceae bacterium]MBP7100306.1 MOSC domain-containing protein [Leptotrichiaceae bacterium]MBP7739635.1 MOSC domain-containing protein [Leptotrichiaceae bacterium]MBP9629977.1 MOSC domain-containing protein [Leptotrichiaceae bacterium]
MGKIEAICTSEKKGTQKKEVLNINLIENFGLENDAHGGNWHRQVSLLCFESVENFKSKGAPVDFGSFGENLIISGLDFKKILPGTILQGDNFELEITQIGKECHSHCHIYHAMGDCIMPREGVFAIVKKGGKIEKGKEINIK